MAQDDLTISDILQELADQYEGIVPEREVFERVLARRPSRAKDPYAGIREKLRFGAPRVGWVRLGGGELMPLRVALRGLRFRIIPDDDEFAADVIARSRLDPFVAPDARDLRLEDAQGRPLPARDTTLPIGEGLFGTVSVPALDLGGWFRRTGFEPGDSIVVAVHATAPLTLRLEREPAAAFRADEVLDQERALVDGLAEQLAHSRVDMLFPEDSVLPIYARAPWRNGYPGRPWQQLVAADRRLRLVDGTYIADASFRPPMDLIFGGTQAHDQLQEEFDEALLAEIAAFQADLRASRRAAAESGLWDGIAPRISTARVIFDQHDAPATLYAGPVDALHDHSADIEERAARGDYDDWDDGLDVGDFDDMDPGDEDDAYDDLFDIEDIEDIRAFMEQNPELVAATQKLMASLSADELEQLQEAQTADDVQRVLTRRLNELLRREPALFVALEPELPSGANGNGHTNGNGRHPDDPQPDEEEWDEEEGDEEEWDEEEGDDEDDEVDEDWLRLEGVLDRSSDLMELFYQHLLDHGKSEATATSRAGDLWVYAEFLGNYYDRSLDQGDYATLDECLFFFYPRKMFNSSPRQAREMCTSIKQFYAFLRAEGIVETDAFAQAMWRRRDQAARVVDLYDRLDSNSPLFERLFARLFEPYTV